MNVKEIIKAWLKEHKYEGLFNSDIECGCKLDDFMPCGEMRHDCEAGYIQPGSHDGFDFMVRADKPPKQPEPPAPDISKGVWLRSAWSGHWWPWDSSLECRADVVMVNGEKFVRQGVPDGFCQHSCAYFSLVRRLAACLRGGKWSDFVKITNEAKRISPETKGE